MPADNPLEHLEDDSVETPDSLDSFEPLKLDDDDFKPMELEPIVDLEDLEPDEPSEPEDFLGSLAPVETEEPLDEIEPIGSLETLEANEPFDAIDTPGSIDPIDVIDAVETPETPTPLDIFEAEESFASSEALGPLETLEPLATPEAAANFEVEPTDEGTALEPMGLAATLQQSYLSSLANKIARAAPLTSKPMFGGSVVKIASGACTVRGISHRARLEDMVVFGTEPDSPRGQIVHVDTDTVTVRPFSSPSEIGIGDRAWLIGAMSIAPHTSWKGRTVNAVGQPIDGKGPLIAKSADRPLNAKPPPALERKRIDEPLPTGIKAIDMFTPLCRGQRIGIFAGSGVGKSTLLQMLAAGPQFDTAVVALVGERGREVREMLEEGLGAAAERTVAVVATSDESPMMRRLAPATAITIAEYFRDKGDDVILIVDSITRFAHASRDGAMSSGEVPVARGYSPSVFSEMAGLLERTGPGAIGQGTITGVFSVLVDGDDHDEPIADNIRGTLDGHIVLDRSIAEQGRYPAIDVFRSISRLAPKVWTPEQENLVLSLRAMIARYEEGRDLRMLGGHKSGVDPLVDQAVQLVPILYDVLRQIPSDGPCLDAFGAVAEALASNAAK